MARRVAALLCGTMALSILGLLLLAQREPAQAGGSWEADARPLEGQAGDSSSAVESFALAVPGQVIRDLSVQPADFTLIGPGNPQDNPGSQGMNDWIGFGLFGGDVNGDNRADLIAGAPNHSDNAGNAVDDSGRVYSLYNDGTRRLGVYDLLTDTSSLQVQSWINQLHIGQTFATEDIDGDGYRDLSIGSPGIAPPGPVTGTVFVFKGGPMLTGTRTLSPTMQADYRFKSGEATSSFSARGGLAAGQLNGAGPSDLVVGEGAATGPGNRGSAGAVFVFFGRGNLPPLWDLANTPADLTIYGPAPNASLGEVSVADVNGDGTPDLIARDGFTVYVFYGPLQAGTIDLAVTPADATITSLNFGSLGAGDIDGDHKAEIVVSYATFVDVVRGGTLVVTQTITDVLWARFNGLLNDPIPRALHTLDWNGDGYADLAVGERGNDVAYVVFGRTDLTGTSPMTITANWIISGVVTGEQFGFSVSSGDLDGDLGTDLIIGSRNRNVDNHPDFFKDAGAAYVLYGTPKRLWLPVILHGFQLVP